MALISLDLETFGTKATSVVTNIGAVAFSTNGKEHFVFDNALNIQEQLDIGRDVTESTIKWWLKQSEAARNKVAIVQEFPENYNINVLTAFTEFCAATKEIDGSLTVWGNGSDFDNAVLLNVYDTYGLPRPWLHYENRCYRTIKALANSIGKPIDWVSPTVAHDALSDARAQALNAIVALKVLGLA